MSISIRNPDSLWQEVSGVISPKKSDKLEITFAETDPAAANGGLNLVNTEGLGQTQIRWIINSVLKGKLRVDYAGNLTWVATGGHGFFAGGDFGVGNAVACFVNGATYPYLSVVPPGANPVDDASGAFLQCWGNINITSGANYMVNGTAGANSGGAIPVYNDGSTSGQLTSITIAGGIITAYSVIP